MTDFSTDPGSSVSPDFWNNLMQFGFATMAAGAKPGATTLGAIGQGGLAATQSARQLRELNAKTNLENAQANYYGADTQNKLMTLGLQVQQINAGRALYGLPPITPNDLQAYFRNGQTPNMGAAPQSYGSNGAQSVTAAPQSMVASPQPMSGPGPQSMAATGTQMPSVQPSAPRASGAGAAPAQFPAPGTGALGPGGIPYAVWQGQVAPTKQQASWMAGYYQNVVRDPASAQIYRNYAMQTEPGFQINSDFSQGPIAGGPADPKYIGAADAAKIHELSRPGAQLIQNGHVIGQTPVVVEGVDANGRPYKEYRYLVNQDGTPATAAGGPSSANQSAPLASPPSGVTVGGGLTGGRIPTSQPQPSSPQTSGMAPLTGTNEQGLPRFQTGLSPLAEQSAKTRGEELEKYGAGLTAAAAAAKEGNMLFDQMMLDSQDFRMGRFSETANDLKANVQGLLGSMGIKTPNLDQQLGSYQAFVKNSGQLTRTAVHETSSRAAAQEYVMIQGTLPGPEMTDAGFKRVAAQWQGLYDYHIAKDISAQKWRQTHEGTLDGFEQDWNSRPVTPGAFLAERLAKSDPVAFKNMIGKLQPQARQRLQNELRYIQNNGYLQ